MARMFEYINPSSIISEVRMGRKKKPTQTYMLVEGDTDINFYKNIIDRNNCVIKAYKGKENVLEAISYSNRQGYKGVLAVVDSDFDNILGVKCNTDNTVCTDSHDIETMMLGEDTFERFICEYGDDEKICAFNEKTGENIFQKITDIGIKIGRLRLISKINNYVINFKDIEYEIYIENEYNFRLNDYIKQILYNSKMLDKKQEIIEELEENNSIDYEVCQICRGHDLTDLISVIFSNKLCNKSLGNKSAIYIDRKDVERSLRLAYNFNNFYDSAMYLYIKEWQNANFQWQIIKTSLLHVA